jgi:signal transduction histidine kinase
MYEGAGVVWVAGSSGFGFFDGRQLQRVRSNVDGIFEGTSGIAFDRMGNLWLNSGAGALRILSSSVTQLLHSADHLTDVEVFNDRDGLTGKPTQRKPAPSLIVDAHGRLWFATAGSLVSADPQHFSEGTDHFDVLIESLTLDGRLLLPQGLNRQAIQAKPGDRHSLEVNFAALNLSQPERMTYRYRLVGEDAAWQDAGSRRQAFYTRLRPGSYTFEVSAREGGGPWIELQAPLRIDVPQAFYQTIWFYALVLLAVALLLFAAYLNHLRQVTQRIRLLSEERSRERVKIARDLHDTLLQGIHGLMLRFHFAAQKVTERTQREELEGALEFADRLLTEGRERVRHLRTPQLPMTNLTDSIVLIGNGLNREGDVEFSVKEEGVPRALRPSLQDEVFCIAREALTNAFEHSHASSISVTIDYSSSYFRLSCFDNGRGVDPGTLEEGHAGHWGIQGMRERAMHIGARFENRSDRDAGTEIAILVPSARAYEKRSRWGRLRRHL